MFTGIVETMGEMIGSFDAEGVKNFWIRTSIAPELKIDQSVCHDGICLTVVEIKDDAFRVQVIDETIEKTNIGSWANGKKINLERSLPANGRFDGHIVQGHVDTTARLIKMKKTEGQLSLEFEHDPAKGITVNKGSICINGVSLTVVNSAAGSFSVALIPYTTEHTNLGLLNEGSTVNIEFDIVGKYIAKMIHA